MQLLTPAGTGGVAVVACGAAEWGRVERHLRRPSGGPLGALRPGSARLAVLATEGGELDQVLVVARPDGALELHFHGSPAVLDALSGRFGRLAAAAPRDPADALMRAAIGAEQLALAIEQERCNFTAFLTRLDGMQPGPRRRAARAAWERSRPARALAHPHRVVLCGAQNAGKSTLMNRLLFAERVLAGSLPGLTRDPVRELTCLSGYPYQIVDTAGEGDVADEIDRRALDRGRAARAGADRLLVVDGSCPPAHADRALRVGRALVIRSKADLPAAPWPEDFVADLVLSCRDAEAAAQVRHEVGELLRRWRGLPPAGPVGGPAALSEAQSAALCRRLARED